MYGMSSDVGMEGKQPDAEKATDKRCYTYLEVPIRKLAIWKVVSTFAKLLLAKDAVARLTRMLSSAASNDCSIAGSAAACLAVLRSN